MDRIQMAKELFAKLEGFNEQFSAVEEAKRRLRILEVLRR